MYDFVPTAVFNTNPVDVVVNPLLPLNGTILDIVFLFTSTFPDLRERLVRPVFGFLDTPKIVPRTAATAESVSTEKSLLEAVLEFGVELVFTSVVLRCGASAQRSQDLRRSTTLDTRLLSSAYARESSLSSVVLPVLQRDTSEPSEI